MIAYIRGTLVSAEPDGVIVEAGQIGYRVYVPASALDRLPPSGSEVKLYTYFQVREDAMQLFGFLTRDERDVFRLLLGVNGVGPKVALGVLSALSPNELRFAVAAGDDKTISKAPGMGKKTAQKVILELRDKLSLEDALDGKTTAPQTAAGERGDAKSEAVLALTALGYTAAEAGRAVRQVENADSMEVEEILKQALKRLI